MADVFLGVPGGDVLTETPDGLLKTDGSMVRDNGVYEDGMNQAYSMPGMSFGGSRCLDGKSSDYFVSEPRGSNAAVATIKNGK